MVCLRKMNRNQLLFCDMKSNRADTPYYFKDCNKRACTKVQLLKKEQIEQMLVSKYRL